MLVRQPVAAGRFYPEQPTSLRMEVRTYLDREDANGQSPQREPFLLMLPHAGYVYCGSVIGSALAGQKLPEKLVVLCPNHTGRGKPLGVWPHGDWLTPLGCAPVDGQLAGEIISSPGGFEADIQSHVSEHSIEVILPFLQMATRLTGFVPICVGTGNAAVLRRAGEALGCILCANPGTALVVSSDMNHYEAQDLTLAKDNLAIERVLQADPEGLLETVRQHGISMCGAAPMALALYAARALGKMEMEVSAHDTSGRASGDYEHVVGYAGIRGYIV